MNNMTIKQIFQFDIPYFPNKKLHIDLYWRVKKFNRKELMLSIWKYHKLVDIVGYEDEWGTRWWKHIKIWEV